MEHDEPHIETKNAKEAKNSASATASAEDDVTRVQLEDKEVILIGTAHISQQSVEIVQKILHDTQPDVVCVELDEERFKAMRKTQNFEELDLKQIIRNGQLMFLTARLALTSFQKRMGSYTGVKPGAEMNAAVDVSEEIGAKLVLCDRNVRTTLLRAWRLTPWWKRAGLVMTLIGGAFERTEINEEELAKLRQTHNISNILEEMGDILPEVKTVLVDERDTFMAHQIQTTQGERIAVVIGAAHKPGILRKLQTPIKDATAEAISTIPNRSLVSRALPWILPAIIIALFIYGFIFSDWQKIKTAVLAWVLANGLLSALGALIARGHPLTILSAFIAAPITSLNPTIGAGMVTAFVQAMYKPPRVKDIEQIGDDLLDRKRRRHNLLARVILVFFLSSLGSSIGTFVAAKFLIDLTSKNTSLHDQHLTSPPVSPHAPSHSG